MIKFLQMVKRYEILCVFLIAAVFIGIKPPVLHAQEVSQLTVYGYPAQITYTMDHPIDPTLMILATPDDRYAIAPLDGCNWVGAGETAFLYRNGTGEPYLWIAKISAHDPNPYYNCHIRVLGPVDPDNAEPCLIGQYGTCDVSLEQGG